MVHPVSRIAISVSLPLCLFLAACNNSRVVTKPSAHINEETKFTQKDFGVQGSPRVTTRKAVRKGGGRYQVGKPYIIRGKRYYPKEDPNYRATGIASWYGPNFHGRLTANGEVYDQYSLSAAHPTLPLPSYARVTNLENGSSVTVRVNDRGPFAHNRVIDLSARAARLLGYEKKGVAKVKVEYVGKARLDGLDEDYLVASYDRGTLDPSGIPLEGGSRTVLAQSRSVLPKPRQILEAFTPNSFVAPVPVSRPLSSAGIPLDLASGRIEPASGLINGYVSENAIHSRIEEAFDLTETGSHPSLGMSDLVRLEFGPFKNEKELAMAESILARCGILQRISSARSGPESLLLIAASEDAGIILQSASKAGLPVKK